MKRRSIAWLGIALLGACSVGSARTVAGPVPLAHGEASSFTPLVAASSATPRCVVPSEPPMAEGARALALRYPSPMERQVTVTMDRDGVPTRYLDVRGDLSESDDQEADRTTIGVYIEQGYAVLSNRRGSDPPDMLEVPIGDVLTSPALGNPSAVMRNVLDTCSGAP